MQMSHKIKTTNAQCFPVPSLKTNFEQSWSSNHRRVFVAYTEQELRSAKNGAKGHIQIVKHSSLTENK